MKWLWAFNPKLTLEYIMFLIVVLVFEIIVVVLLPSAKRVRFLFVFLFIEYLLSFWGSAIFCRGTNEQYLISMDFLWTYKEYFKGDFGMLFEGIANIIIFIPFDILLMSIMKDRKLCFWISMLISSCISLVAEVIQFISKKVCLN